MRPVLLACLSLLFVSSGVVAQEGDPVAQAGGNIGRTAKDDAPDAGAEAQEIGSLGTIKVPLTMDRDCLATAALYTPKGRLVRILGQVIPLKKGLTNARWDGMDLFGNIVPAGTELTATVIANDPIRAFYEFSVAAPKVAPWGGTFGEGKDRRQGGWLADHSAPGCVAAAGDKVLIGSSLAEHGDNLIAVDLKGRKVWGLKLAGWQGPRLLAADGGRVYALERNSRTLYAVNPEWTTDAQGRERIEVGKVLDTGADPVQAMAAAGGKLYLFLRNHEDNVQAFRVALDNGNIDYPHSFPQVLDNKAPSEFHIGAQTAFANTFTSPGNPQNGAGMIPKNGDAYVVLGFKKPVELGTVALPQVGGAAKAEVYVLKEGEAYDEKKTPIGMPDQGGELALMDMTDFGSEWQKMGASALSNAVNYITAPRKGMKTSGMFIRCVPGKNVKRGEWSPRLAMARLMAERIEQIPVKPRMTAKGEIKSGGAADRGWNVKTTVPIGEIYPVTIVMDLGGEATFDGVCFLNCVSPTVFVDAFKGASGGDPTEAPDSEWREIGRYAGAYDKKLRHLSASRSANEQYLYFKDQVTTRALRFRVVTGFMGGRWGSGPDNNFLAEAADVSLVRLVDPIPSVPTHLLRVADAKTGKTQAEWASGAYDVPVCAADPGGRLFVVSSGVVARASVDMATGRMTLEPVGALQIKAPVSLAVAADRIVVGDNERKALFVLATDGKLLATIGDKGGWKRGPWDPANIHRPSGVAFASDGSIWIAETTLSPKRVAHFGADGKFIEEFLGPPMYGGGGFLDPNLKAFYDRSQEFELDWVKGTSRLKNLNDRLGTEESPAPENNSFTYTGMGCPLYVNGRRYVLGGGAIAILDEGSPVWRPAAVMGAADKNQFLLGKESWKKHWARLDLAGKYFIWCDRNGDGMYQVEEVELFEAPADRPFDGAVVGPDLSLWGTRMRIKPAEITDKGVPIYRSSDLKPFDYAKLAPHYPRNYTLAGPKSAKPQYSGFKYVTADGCLIQEGQPYIVQADGTILGGAPDSQPSEFIPPIPGEVLNTPWGFAGGAMTKSAIGEVAIVNSMRGYWFVWAARYGIVVGTFFNGKTGGWGWGMPVERGYDVSGRKQEWEGWHGNFVKALNGNYYAQAGKGFHGISRVEGLDSFAITNWPVRVTAEDARLSAVLRPIMVARAKAAGANRGENERSVKVRDRAGSMPKAKLDGEIEDWGKVGDMQVIGSPKQNCVFDIACDDKGLYLAVSGRGKMTSKAADWKDLYRAGFGIDFCFRREGRQTGPTFGERRVVVGRFGGQWTGVLYDYQPAGPEPASAMSIPSPFLTMAIGRVCRLGEKEIQIAVKEDALGLDTRTMEAVTDLGEEPTIESGGRATKGGARWTMEILLPWSTTGLQAGEGFRGDVGILEPNQAGDGVGNRVYWSNQVPGPLGDAALQALLNPGAWGAMRYR